MDGLLLLQIMKLLGGSEALIRVNLMLGQPVISP